MIILNWPLRYFINLVIYILIAAIIVFFLFGEYLKLAGYVINIILIMVPYYLHSRSPRLQQIIKPNFIEACQAILAWVFFSSLLGSLDFYHNPATWWYDTLIHFVNCLGFFSISGYLIVVFELYFFKRQNIYLTLFINLAVVILLSFLWEFYEAIIDVIFTKASMFGQSGEKYYDTTTDLAADFIGGLVSLWLIFRYIYGYILSNIKSS